MDTTETAETIPPDPEIATEGSEASPSVKESRRARLLAAKAVKHSVFKGRPAWAKGAKVCRNRFRLTGYLAKPYGGAIRVHTFSRKGFGFCMEARRPAVSVVGKTRDEALVALIRAIDPEVEGVRLA